MELANINMKVRVQYNEGLEVNSSKLFITVKRLMDVFGSLAGLLLLSPLLLFIAILIKLEDKSGSIFFKQVRVGKDGKLFTMLKFRSMVVNAENQLDSLLGKNEVSGAMFKMKNDPRITKIGKFIRKTSIDELPQLLNVLKGDMSLVGPRPPLVREVNEYNEYHMQRLLVTPGCTGLWQISGRSEIGFEDMVELDIKYIKEQGILRDIKIILKTVKVLLSSNSNAY